MTYVGADYWLPPSLNNTAPRARLMKRSSHHTVPATTLSQPSRRAGERTIGSPRAQRQHTPNYKAAAIPTATTFCRPATQASG